MGGDHGHQPASRYCTSYVHATGRLSVAKQNKLESLDLACVRAARIAVRRKTVHADMLNHLNLKFSVPGIVGEHWPLAAEVPAYAYATQH